jgi:hypothetical protein
MGGLQRLVRDIHTFEGALGDGVKVMFPEEKPIFSKYEIPPRVEARGIRFAYLSKRRPPLQRFRIDPYRYQSLQHTYALKFRLVADRKPTSSS